MHRRAATTFESQVCLHFYEHCHEMPSSCFLGSRLLLGLLLPRQCLIFRAAILSNCKVASCCLKMERLIDLTKSASYYGLLFLGRGTQYDLAKYHLQTSGSLTTAVLWKPWLCIASVRAASMPAASTTLAMRSAYSRMALAITALLFLWTFKRKLLEQERPQLSGYQSLAAGFALDEA